MQLQGRQLFYANYYDETGAGDIIWRDVQAWADDSKVSQRFVADEAVSNRTKDYDKMMSRLFPDGDMFEVGQIVVFFAELEYKDGDCYLANPESFLWY